MPICQDRGVNLSTFLGESSTTACHNLVERVRASERPCRLFYISDFDPAGLSIPVAAARKIEFAVRESGDDLDIRVYPIALTAAQCISYRLPRTPIKESERRGAAFEARHGEGATELDALESLRPGELRKIVLKAIDHYYDDRLRDKGISWYESSQNLLDFISNDVAGDYSEDIDRLSAQYEEIRSELKGRLSAIGDEVRNLWQAIGDELSGASPGIGDLPQGVMVDDMPGPLLDTTRGYMEQMLAYKSFQGK